MTSLQKWGGVLALVAIVLAIGAYAYPKAQSAGLVGSATACTDGYTCVTNLETQGNQIVDGTTSLVGAVSLTATTTITNPLKILPTNGVACIEMYATSTATKVKLSFYATSTIAATNGVGLLAYAYGTCP